jgi:hypothetical protein
MTNMEVPMEVNVIKSDEISKPINDIPFPVKEVEPSKPSFSLSNLYPNMDTNVGKGMVTPLIISEDKPVTTAEPKSPRKEMVIVKNEDDIDETSSLANFFDDMKKIVEEKGIKVEKTDNKTFSLFEDAPEVEK